ncbi:MAG: tyrosine-type recombinase/integrase [Bacteroidetes bacterium]|nr:tyrosine-type recombinase/integrase [Bacteroidota bacterium]
MGLIKRGSMYYAEFFDSQRFPKTKRFSLRTRNKRSAILLHSRMQLDRDEGAWDPWDGPFQFADEDPHTSPSETLFADLVSTFLASRQRLGRSPETIRTYSEVLHGLEGRMPQSGCWRSELVDSIIDFVYDKSVAPATQSKRYGHVRTFTKWAAKEGLIASDPVDSVEKPKKRQVIPKSISIEDLELMCQAMESDYLSKLQSNLVTKGEIVWRIPLFRFALFTGMRASELARLTWGDLDQDLRLVSIREQKNGHQQTIPLCSSAAELIRHLEMGLANEFVFHSPRGHRTSRSPKRFAERASQVFRHYRRGVGLPEHLCFHSLRHGFCTALANAGKSSYIIKAAARHKDITTSLRYVHVSNRKLLSELDDVFSNNQY